MHLGDPHPAGQHGRMNAVVMGQAGYKALSGQIVDGVCKPAFVAEQGLFT